MHKERSRCLNPSTCLQGFCLAIFCQLQSQQADDHGYVCVIWATKDTEMVKEEVELTTSIHVTAGL